MELNLYALYAFTAFMVTNLFVFSPLHLKSFCATHNPKTRHAVVTVANPKQHILR